ncbi:response regulator [Sulfuritalea sp.]|uniref:response regulator n=1 Tax=Sulfuritalea sp. TaxID=2480090 RepID=UPI00286E6158|nr:EAL domain-containing protein [Sulfuritalea sp.]
MDARAAPQEARSPLRVLIVEDSADDAELLLHAVRQSGYEPGSARVETAAAMRAALLDKPWDLILSDCRIPGFDGMEALRIANESGLDLPFIVVSGKVGEEVAIDDFGTGFSSLSYLARLPVDTLKIDRSFVIEMTAGPQGLALVSTIINLAQSRKLKVVAEGVETEEQQRLLRLLNCDEMQGYLFSKPVSAALFETRFLARLAPDDKPA